jgi:ABC-2 type transport system permease protein
LALLAGFIALFYPLIQGLDSLNELLQIPVFQSLIPEGGADYTTPEGFLGTEFFTFMPLVLAILAVGAGLGVAANEEARGTIDLLLSTPLPRWRIIVEKSAAFLLELTAILALGAAGLALAILLTPDLDLVIEHAVAATFALLPVVLLIMTVALCLSTILRSRGLVVTITIVWLVASYFANTFSQMSGAALLDVLGRLSFFRYFNAVHILQSGMNWTHFVLLLAVAIVPLGLAVAGFERRDLHA